VAKEEASAPPPVSGAERDQITPREPGAGRAARPRSLAWPVALLALVVLAGLVVWLALDRSGGDDQTAAQPLATTTATVVRRDLVETESFSGTLGYAERRPIVGYWNGTVTALVPEGAVVRRGEPLFRVDDRPVILMIGPVPAYRPLAEDVPTGRDVRQLERNLVALGYDADGELVVDQEFTAETGEAVEAWQEDLGLEADGIVRLGDVVFLPGAQRIGQQRLSEGSPLTPGVEVMEVASTAQIVELDLPADQQALVSEDDAVVVELPDGTRVPGTVADVGTVAESQTLPGGEAGEPTIPVTIQLDERAPTNLDQAPVTIELTKEASPDVLAVPVTALVALRGGGYAIEVRDGATTMLVAVEPGLYADGYVEITGDVDEGAEVVVPE
jgi:peptidoglycan hydrolase-like protein with peptidoglycan-binding domain